MCDERQSAVDISDSAVSKNCRGGGKSGDTGTSFKSSTIGPFCRLSLDGREHQFAEGPVKRSSKSSTAAFGRHL